MPQHPHSRLSLADKLAKLQILELADDIFAMSYSQLRHHFNFPTGGALNTSRLIKSLIWQDLSYIKAAKLEKFRGNIRSYWYARVKPVVTRAKAKKAADKYNMMIDQLAVMIREYRLFDYADFGFLDENQPYRLLGSDNPHLFVVAEKAGHFPFLQDLWANFGVTVNALGGQPSVLSSEYFLHDLVASGFDLDTDVHIFTIVDFDPAGDSISQNFLRHLSQLGYTGTLTRVDLVRPEFMAHDQIALNKYPLPKSKRQKTLADAWIKQRGGGLEAFGFGKYYGVEADAMAWDQLTAAFAQRAAKYFKVAPANVVQRRLTGELISALKNCFLARHFN